tara:strand:+ start:5240 stop:5542 length:303 start_codon:yes stop_codon:yes gene_type:complete
MKDIKEQYKQETKGSVYSGELESTSYTDEYVRWMEQKLASNTEIIGVIMPRELTAENGAKGLLIGEFYEEIEHDEGTYKVAVEWTTIKDIYKKIVAHYEA